MTVFLREKKNDNLLKKNLYTTGASQSEFFCGKVKKFHFTFRKTGFKTPYKYGRRYVCLLM